jgi:hypothetical protein
MKGETPVTKNLSSYKVAAFYKNGTLSKAKDKSRKVVSSYRNFQSSEARFNLLRLDSACTEPRKSNTVRHRFRKENSTHSYKKVDPFLERLKI